MAASSLSHRSVPVSHPHGFALLDRLVGSWSRLTQEIRIRSDLRRLGEFDDAALSDIGVSRGGIEGEVRTGRIRRT